MIFRDKHKIGIEKRALLDRFGAGDLASKAGEMPGKRFCHSGEGPVGLATADLAYSL